MREWMWPGLRDRVTDLDVRAEERFNEGRSLRSQDRLPTDEQTKGSLFGRPGLAPFSALFVGVVPCALMLGAVGELVGGPRWLGVLGAAVGVYVVDRWYSFGARRLALLPAAGENESSKRS